MRRVFKFILKALEKNFYIVTRKLNEKKHKNERRYHLFFS